MNQDWILIIESGILGVAVGLTQASGAQAGHLIWSANLVSTGQSAAKLPDLVAEGLEKNHLDITAISGIVVATGPGSFTGLRIGLAYAYGLAVGINARTQGKKSVKWRGVSSLVLLQTSGAEEIWALPSTKTSGYLAVRVDGKVHLEIIDLDTGRLSVKQKQKLSDAKVSVVSIGSWPLLRSLVAGSFKEMAPETLNLRSLELMAKDAADQWLTGFNNQMPLLKYMKKSTVEERAEQSAAAK